MKKTWVISVPPSLTSNGNIHFLFGVTEATTAPFVHMSHITCRIFVYNLTLEKSTEHGQQFLQTDANTLTNLTHGSVTGA